MKKILILTSSGQPENLSATKYYAQLLSQGMIEVGAETNTIDLFQSEINPCVGCLNCWSKTPGKCIFDDAMSNIIYPSFLDADIVVLATPIYHHTMNGIMKNFIDRTIALQEPFWESVDDQYRHPIRENHPKIVVLGVGGWSGDWAFENISSLVNHIYHVNLIAEIYTKTSRNIMHHRDYYGVKAEQKKAFILAGKEIAQNQTISNQLLKEMTIIPENIPELVEGTHLIWKTCMENKWSMAEFIDKGSYLCPRNIYDFLDMLKWATDVNLINDINLSIQFIFLGAIKGKCFISIKNGNIESGVGVTNDSKLIITVPYGLWLDILHGKKDFNNLLEQRKIKLDGDISELALLQSIMRQKQYV